MRLSILVLLFLIISVAVHAEPDCTFDMKMGGMYMYKCNDGSTKITQTPLHQQRATKPVALPDRRPTSPANPKKSEGGIVVTRVYKSSNMYHRAVVTTNKAVWVKCAGLDRSGNHLSVSLKTQVKPPADEVMIRSAPGLVKAKCWVDR